MIIVENIIEKTENRDIIRIDRDGRRQIEDLIIKEHALTITLNDGKYVRDRQYATVFCSPSDLEMLGLGFLLSEELIESLDDIDSIFLSDDNSELKVYVKNNISLAEKLLAKRDVTSGCGRRSNPNEAIKLNIVSSDFKVSSESIIRFSNEFQAMSALYKSTGGTHGVVLCSEDNILIFKEDIGRHNALDKVFGECLVKGIKTDDKIVLTSGRISSEMLIKSAMRGIPVIASRSAPTSMAIQLAENAGVTLVGFVRGGRMNIYSHSYRIK